MSLFARILLVAAVLPFALASPYGSSSSSTSTSSCGDNEFLYTKKDCCVPHGGVSNPPTPPSDSSCPSYGWQWHATKECCVPTHPPSNDEPTPQCDNGWSWDDNQSKCCEGGGSTTSTAVWAKPSSHGKRERRTRARNTQ